MTKAKIRDRVGGREWGLSMSTRSVDSQAFRLKGIKMAENDEPKSNDLSRRTLVENIVREANKLKPDRDLRLIGNRVVRVDRPRKRFENQNIQ